VGQKGASALLEPLARAQFDMALKEDCFKIASMIIIVIILIIIA